MIRQRLYIVLSMIRQLYYAFSRIIQLLQYLLCSMISSLHISYDKVHCDSCGCYGDCDICPPSPLSSLLLVPQQLQIVLLCHSGFANSSSTHRRLDDCGAWGRISFKSGMPPEISTANKSRTPNPEPYILQTLNPKP